MAANSKRERIVQQVVTELEAVSSVTTVIRKLPTYEDLGKFALTQLPVVAVVAGLPVPIPHPATRGTGKDIFLSELALSLYCYFQDNVNPDSTLSTLLDDLWAKLYTDQEKAGLALGTVLKPTAHQDYWHPFYAFRLDAIITYTHGIGGI